MVIYPAQMVQASVLIKPTYDVRAFGAKGDGKTLDTEALQKAIDRAGQAGGGVVLLSPGAYLTGTVQIRDNVTLRVLKGATLLGSPNPNDYPLLDPFQDGSGLARGRALVVAVDAHDVGIDGSGTIDGNGPAFHRERSAVDRPFLLRFSRCRNIGVKDITLQNPGAWTSHYQDCDGVLIQNVTINSHGNGNNDGMDIDASRHVTITGCDVSSGDDAICLKTTLPKPCQDIHISHCRLSSDWADIKFGTESIGTFEDVTVSDCALHDTKGGGVEIFSVDGAVIRHVTVSSLTMDRVDMPIFLRLGARLKTFRPGQTPQPVGSITTIRIEHIKITNPPAPRVHPPTAIFMTGIPGHRIGDVVLSDITIEASGGGTPADAERTVPEKEQAYPNYPVFGVLPASGIYLRHVESITLHDVHTQVMAADQRPLIVTEDVLHRYP